MDVFEGDTFKSLTPKMMEEFVLRERNYSQIWSEEARSFWTQYYHQNDESNRDINISEKISFVCN